MDFRAYPIRVIATIRFDDSCEARTESAFEADGFGPRALKSREHNEFREISSFARVLSQHTHGRRGMGLLRGQHLAVSFG